MKNKILCILIIAIFLLACISNQQKEASKQHLNSNTTKLIEPSVGKCGDGICSPIEKQKNICPQDCQDEISEINTENISQPILGAANIVIDYSSEKASISKYLFGTLGSPKVSAQGYSLVNEIGFKLVEVNTKTTDLDAAISSAISAGAEPMIWFENPQKMPVDLDGYLAGIESTLKQVNAYGARLIRYGNEPDYTAFWTGTQQEFFELYHSVADRIKSVNPDFIIEAPGFQNALSGGNINPWVIGFLEYCKSNSVPVDILSFHTYSNSPYTFYKSSKLVNQVLVEYSSLSPIYGTPKIANDEWSLLVGDLWRKLAYASQFDTAWTAAHNILSLINMIENNLDVSIRYGGVFNIADANGYCHDFPLTDCDGNGKPVYYAFKAFNMLADSALLSTLGGDRMNFAAISGKKDNEIIIVLSNYDIKRYIETYETKTNAWNEYNSYKAEFGEPKTYASFNIVINNIPSYYQQAEYETYLIDDQNDLTLESSKNINIVNSLAVDGDIIAPSVKLIKIKLS